MKRIISVFMTVLLLLLSFSGFEAMAKTEETTNEKYIKIMYNIGITDRMATEDALLTRAEYAVILKNLLNMENMITPYTKGDFLDIDGDRAEAGSIDLVYNLGIMIDVEDGKFRPDENLTFSEACEGIVRLLGYKDMGEKKGFVNAAVSLGIAKGINSQNGYIAMGNLSRMLYNSLNITLASKKIVGGSVIVNMGENVVLLRDYLGIYEKSGRITAVRGMSLYGVADPDFSDTQVEIDNTLYETQEYFTSDHLGVVVDFWYKINDEEKPQVIYAELHKDYSELSLNYSDVTRVDNDYIEYEVSEDKTKKIKIDQNVRILKNGVPLASISDIDYTNKGILRLVMDKNVVIGAVAMEYDSYVVKSVGSKIRFKYTDSVYLNTKDTENEYIITNGKDYFELSDIGENDVISIAHDNNTKFYYLRLSRSSVYGEISESSEEKSKNYYTIKGNIYGVDKNFYALTVKGGSELTKLEPGFTSEFYIDFMNEICGMSYTGSMQYAYINGVANLGSAFEDNYAMNIITQRHREFREYHFAKNVVLNGVTTNREKTFTFMKSFMESRDESNPPIMKFRENSKGEIEKIVTTVVKGHTTTENAITAPVKRNLSDGGYPYWLSYKKFLTGNASTPDYYFKNNISLYSYGDNDTICLKIPPNGNEDEFEFGNAYDLGITTGSGGTYYDCVFYDLNEFFEPSFMIYFAESSDGGVKADDNLVVGVESVVRMLDNDGELVAKIIGYCNGTLTEYTVSESETESFNSALTLQKGDFVQLSVDYKNRVEDLKYFFTYNLDSFDFDRIKSGGDIKTRFENDSTNMVFNKVKNANENFILVDGDPTATTCTFILSYNWPSGNYITLYDGKEFSKIKMENVESDDVMFGAFAGAEGFRNLIVIRDVDLALVESNIVMP